MDNQFEEVVGKVMIAFRQLRVGLGSVLLYAVVNITRSMYRR
jgi:hypothetical protein